MPPPSLTVSLEVGENREAGRGGYTERPGLKRGRLKGEARAEGREQRPDTVQGLGSVRREHRRAGAQGPWRDAPHQELPPTPQLEPASTTAGLSYPEAGARWCFSAKRRRLNSWGSWGQAGIWGIGSPHFKEAPGLLKPTPVSTKGLCQEPGQGWEPETRAHAVPHLPHSLSTQDGPLCPRRGSQHGVLQAEDRGRRGG